MLDRIQVFGYRRLARTGAYVGRKMVAFVGPNEAGKSSVLSALRLFDSDNAIRESDATRSVRGQPLDADRVVVRLSSTLTSEQKSRAARLPIEDKELRYVVHQKHANGRRTYLFEPPPRVSPSLQLSLAKAWPSIERGLSLVLNQLEEDEIEGFSKVELDAISAFLKGAGSKPGAEIWDSVNAVLTEHLANDAKLKEKVATFVTYYAWERPGVNLSSLVYNSIGLQTPVFAQFGDEHRLIRAEYVLSDPSTDQSVGLSNLLRLGGIDLDQIRSSAGESGYQRTLVDDANRKLEDFFTQKWKQEQVTVGVDVDGDVLRVHVRDLVEGSAGWMDITERSDGLRTFVGLAAFLESGGFTRPPILLIDEAEHHLHQNAQGDLVRMLEELTAVEQVLYTTHSPACLPSDIGNGVRFVEPIDKGHSRIRHDFWTINRQEHVGFNPLLIVMGAGAAAFSSLRRALISEGESEMLLLPTLIKIATGKADLAYQVAPGIATASTSEMASLDLVASRVVYVVDGDGGGARWKSQLLGSGVPKARIRSLPDGVGLEDLLDRQFYLDSIATLSNLDRDSLDEAPTDVPIKAALEQLSIKGLPGPVAVAEFLLGRHESHEKEIILRASSRRILRELDAWALKAMGVGTPS